MYEPRATFLLRIVMLLALLGAEWVSAESPGICLKDLNRCLEACPDENKDESQIDSCIDYCIVGCLSCGFTGMKNPSVETFYPGPAKLCDIRHR